MIDLKFVSDTLEQIRKHPILYEQAVDELYSNHGLSHLEVLSVFIGNENLSETHPHIESYIDALIEKVSAENILKSDQLKLDVKYKKLQLKAFYPLLIIAVISAVVAIISLYFNYKFQREAARKADSTAIRLKQLEESISSLSQTKKDDPKHTTRMSAPSLTTK